MVIENIARHWAMKDGRTRNDAVIEAVSLTALTAMIGSSVIQFDPIFQGLVISLWIGFLSSTILTELVIPTIYIFLKKDPIQTL